LPLFHTLCGERADEAEFVRRIHLDLIGRIPEANRVAAFLDSREPDKTAKLIDELLASPEYGRNFAILWQNRMGPRSGFVGGNVLEESLLPWLADGFNRNRPWNEMVRDLLLAHGAVKGRPVTNFYIARPTPSRASSRPTASPP
jgi:hypothetical protein